MVHDIVSVAQIKTGFESISRQAHPYRAIIEGRFQCDSFQCRDIPSQAILNIEEWSELCVLTGADEDTFGQ